MLDLTIVLAFAAGVLAVISIGLWEELKKSRQHTADLQHSLDLSFDAAARADERAADVANIHQELLSRPVQAMIPSGSVEYLGDLILTYLNDGGGSAPIIFPTKKGPIQ